MLQRYIRLKARGITPTLAIVDEQRPEGLVKVVRLTFTRYDEETGAAREFSEGVELASLVEEATQVRKSWLAAKEIYETLTGTPFPT
jgi:hypothetical protein